MLILLRKNACDGGRGVGTVWYLSFTSLLRSQVLNLFQSGGTSQFTLNELQIPPSTPHQSLHVQTDFDGSATIPAGPCSSVSSLMPVSQWLEPTHLQVSQFGSRFLPPTMAPIRCLLPLISDRLLLIGHDDGLSVLNMFPHDVTEEGEAVLKGPDEAQARHIWEGEG